MNQILVALGLVEGAGEADALAAIMRLLGFEREVLSLSGAKSAGEAMGALLALKEKAGKVDALSTELEQIKASALAAEVKSLLDEATKDGRVAPAKRAELEQLQAKHGIDALKVCLSMLPKAASAAIPPAADAPSASATHGLSADELEVIKNTGIKPEDYVKHKAAYRRGFQKGEE